MPTQGLHSERLGIKKLRQEPVDYITDLISVVASVNPGAIATVTGALSSAITVPGAQVGDRVEVFPPYTLAGVMVQGYVNAADRVTLSFFNPTGATVTLGAGNWKIQVIR